MCNWNYFLNDEEVLDELSDIMDEFIDDAISNLSNNSSSINAWDIDGINEEFLDSLSLDINSFTQSATNADELRNSIKENMNQVISYKKDSIGSKILEHFVKFVSLKEIDRKWKEVFSYV